MCTASVPSPSSGGRVFIRWSRSARAAVFAATAVSLSAAVDQPSGAAIRQDLRSFGNVATVLHVAAHPDDENTQLITYLARGRGYRMGYLSVTRGDGGQNEIGPEFGERLGHRRACAARTGIFFDGDEGCVTLRELA